MLIACTRLGGGLLSILRTIGLLLAFHAIDTGITLANIVIPVKSVEDVIHVDKPGSKGIWPAFSPPMDGDSRSPCPALNALANHRILPHDGKNIPFTTISKVVKDYYNFSPTFSWFVPHYAAKMLGRNYWKGTMNLGDLCVHNGIEHDASLTRLDAIEQPDQSIPNVELIDRLLACASGRDKKTGKKILLPEDVVEFCHIRRTECKATNPQFMLGTLHKIFGSNNSATMTVIFGGDVDDLNIWLKEERFPDGWTPSRRDKYGVSMASFNKAVFGIELQIPNVPRVTSALN